MMDPEIFERMTDDIALTCTAMGEARGDSREGGSSLEERVATMLAIRNRLRSPKRFGATIKAVCLQPQQFSCWNVTDPNRPGLMVLAWRLITGQPSLDPLADETRFLAQGVIAGTILDTVHGATHYYSPDAMVPPGRVPPWAKGVLPCARVGGQRFFKGV